MSLSKVLSPDLIDKYSQGSCIVTLIEPGLPMSDIVNQLDIILLGKRLFFAQTAVVQAGQRLWLKWLKSFWNKPKNYSMTNATHFFCGLILLGVNGVVRQTPDAKNEADFEKPHDGKRESAYPQIGMVCQ